MKILGVVFSSGLVDVSVDNWEPRLVKLERSLKLWKSCSLSLIGKSLIINTLGISKYRIIIYLEDFPLLASHSNDVKSITVLGLSHKLDEINTVPRSANNIPQLCHKLCEYDH